MSNLPLPRWAYVPGETMPGETYEADADYEALAQVKLLVPAAFRGYVRCTVTPERVAQRFSDRRHRRRAELNRAHLEVVCRLQ